MLVKDGLWARAIQEHSETKLSVFFTSLNALDKRGQDTATASAKTATPVSRICIPTVSAGPVPAWQTLPQANLISVISRQPSSSSTKSVSNSPRSLSPAKEDDCRTPPDAEHQAIALARKNRTRRKQQERKEREMSAFLQHAKSSVSELQTTPGDARKRTLTEEDKQEKRLLTQFLDRIRPHLEVLMLDGKVKSALIAFVLNVPAPTITQIQSLHSKLMCTFKINLQETLFEVLFFLGELVDSKDHAVRLENRLNGAKRSLYIVVYALSHVRLAIVIKAAASRGVSVFLVVDHTQMFCDGSMGGANMNSDDDDKRRVKGFVSTVSRHMFHNKYVIINNEVVIHGFVSFTGHAMMNAGVLVINDIKRLLQRLLEDFAQVLDEREFRPVEKSELKKGEQCEQYSRTERKEGGECAVVDPVEASPEEVVDRFFL